MVGTLSLEKSDPNLVKVRGLYDILDPEEAEWQMRKKELNKLGSLSLFSHEESEATENNLDGYDSDRPITPINESIKVAPKTYVGLSKLIYRRINPRPEWNHISEKDQSSLGAVIMGEVNAVWPLLRRQLADPFLTGLQNKELQRRIIVHCVTVCEQLFIHYVEKVKILNSRGIFSGPANMSRIRAQLALDAGKYLNILSVRRHIISDLKKPPAKAQITFSREEASGTPASPTPLQTPSHLSFRNLVKSSRPKRKLKYQFNLKAEIQSMQTQMPSLNLAKLQQLEPLTDRSNAIFGYAEKGDDEYEELEVSYEEDENMKAKNEDSFTTLTLHRTSENRCLSEPLVPHTLLLEELLLKEKEDDEDFLIMRSPSQAPPSRQRLQSVKTNWSQPESRIKCHSSLGLERVPPPESSLIDPKDPKEDLKLLMAKHKRERMKNREEEQHESDNESYDVPPLIQAITRRDVQNENLRKLKQKEKDLDAKHEEEMKEKMQPLPQPQFPQPPVIQSKLPGASNPINKRPITIRASDVKINDHVDLSTVTLREFLPVYNDLTGDISQATVKELDANLFQGGELREVYSEIMKTVPNVHQHYDSDPLIVSPGTNVDLSKILASSTLVRPRSQQVINPALRRDELDMPWEGQQIVWPKGTNMQTGYPASAASSMSQAQGEGYSAFHRFTPSQLNHPGVEKGSRAYASWLHWWKNTINSDDFFKYLSTQDTDFLSVLFHFYDSDAADSETESMRTAKMETQREREKKLAELKREKEEFIPGLWNVKAVTLGGLGKDPEIEGDEDDEFSDFGTPRSTERSQSFSQAGSQSLRGTPRNSRSRPEKRYGRHMHQILSQNASSKKFKLSRQDVFEKFDKDHPLRVPLHHNTPFASSSSSYQETESTESASFTFPGRKFGINTDDFSSSHQTSSLMTSSQDYSDESFQAEVCQLQNPDYSTSDDSDSDTTLTPSCGISPAKNMPKKIARSQKMNDCHDGITVNSLQAHSLKLHKMQKAGVFPEPSTSTFASSNVGNTSDSQNSGGKLSNDSSGRIIVQKTAEDSGLEKSPEELLSGSMTGEDSTSGYASVHDAPKTVPPNSPEQITDAKQEASENTEGRQMNDKDLLSSISDNRLRSRPVTISVKFEDGTLSNSEGIYSSSYRRRRKSVFRVEDPVDTSQFLEKLDPCKRVAKIAEEGNKQARSGSIRYTATSSDRTHTNASTAKTSKKDAHHEPTIQGRLEIVWYKLKMPDSQKLNCALKYSGDRYIKRLPDIVSSWEHVTRLILQREKHMTSLESFEKEASDPNRFFERGHRGSSVARLTEAKTRATLYKKLETLETAIKASLISIRSRFSDIVTYNGRPYHEKMEWDKVEMLYYLQQERRCVMLKEHGHSQPLDLFISHGQMRSQTILPPTPRRFTQLPLNSVKIAVPE